MKPTPEDVIIDPAMRSVNPPFKGSLDEERVSNELLKLTKTKKTELLFLALFIRILKAGGRAAFKIRMVFS